MRATSAFPDTYLSCDAEIKSISAFSCGEGGKTYTSGYWVLRNVIKIDQPEDTLKRETEESAYCGLRKGPV